MEKMQLIGSATRYFAGRHGVQTVYWRMSPDKGLVKTTRLTKFAKEEGAEKVNNGEMFARIRDRYT